MINRKEVVSRHNITIKNVAAKSPLQLGNGIFGASFDVTGMQSYPESYRAGGGLSTMSEWGFQAFPNPANVTADGFPATMYRTNARSVPYLDERVAGFEEAARYLNANPNRLNLGRLGLKIWGNEGKTAVLDELQNIVQELDLYSGELRSFFDFAGQKTGVRTVAHPRLTMIGWQIDSALLAQRKMQLALDFGGASAAWEGERGKFAAFTGATTAAVLSDRELLLTRKVNDLTYFVKLRFTNGICRQTGAHSFVLAPDCGQLEVTLQYALSPDDWFDDGYYDACADAAKHDWRDYWEHGGIMDFSRSTDPRAFELERRVILSLYLARVNSCGTYPSAETGYVCNSWWGKFHLEMHWWHSAHFSLWGRPELLRQSLSHYHNIARLGRKLAARQGYRGIRWPKMLAPEGDIAPCHIASWLLWQQPLLIFMADGLSRQTGDREIINEYGELVFETAEFMISFMEFDKESNALKMGPPMVDSAEIYRDFPANFNFNFELESWYAGLQIAQQWHQQIRHCRNREIDAVCRNWPQLTIRDNVYVAGASADDTFTNPANRSTQVTGTVCHGEFDLKARNISHPTLLGIYGMLPGYLVDQTTMQKTFEKVRREWNWDCEIWGWDYPLAAMTGLRLQLAGEALDLLLMDKPTNHYQPNGHVWQNELLPTYLPANGGLLYAVTGLCGKNAVLPPGWAIDFENITCFYHLL